MKALTLWQPWASLFLTVKKIETRPWRTQHRGWLGIHAAATDKPFANPMPVLFERICDDKLGKDWRKNVPRGKLLGAVFITDCLRVEDAAPNAYEFLMGDYTAGEGRYAILRSHAVTLPVPIEMSGAQRFFTLWDDVAAEVEAFIPK